jgi:hypothetical protein
MLVFTDLQVFWRCQEATWFEDTIMEPWEDKAKLLRLAEMSYPGSKRGPSPLQLTYGVHAPPSRHRYQELVAAYIPRQLSFPEDILNAFRGVLKLYGSGSSEDLWGLPGTDLAGAIAWYYDQDEPSKRRLGFPSWSWAGWVASPGNGIRFREMPARHSLFEPRYHRFIDKGWKALESPDSSPWGIGEEGTELKYDIPHHIREEASILNGNFHHSNTGLPRCHPSLIFFDSGLVQPCLRSHRPRFPQTMASISITSPYRGEEIALHGSFSTRIGSPKTQVLGNSS